MPRGEGAIGTTAEVYYYHNDHLGSPVAITDSQGNLAWSQDYLPYGEALNEAATATKTRFTFTGKELDPATGLMYYNARWYDPDLGRFTTEDSWTELPDDERGHRVGDSPVALHPYVFCRDNPLRYLDRGGHATIVVGGLEELVAAGIAVITVKIMADLSALGPRPEELYGNVPPGAPGSPTYRVGTDPRTGLPQGGAPKKGPDRIRYIIGSIAAGAARVWEKMMKPFVQARQEERERIERLKEIEISRGRAMQEYWEKELSKKK